jgi:equilibrative nucleoside transporter 1/2/3
MWPHASTVFSVYAVTLSIFPGVLAEDVRNDTLGDWYAVLLILCFNAFDVVGKMVPSWWPSGFEVLAKRPRTVAAAAAARLFFVPAFLAVSKTRVSFASQTRLADSPAACVVLVAALGLTNGWYSSVGMMCAPKAVASHDAETCGTVMVLFLLAGLATGAACGWLWV